jgi:hypothetical protein
MASVSISNHPFHCSRCVVGNQTKSRNSSKMMWRMLGSGGGRREVGGTCTNTSVGKADKFMSQSIYVPKGMLW